jgi:GT2 family glycosyltransferase
MLDVAVIIVSWNVRDYLAECLRSVYAELARTGLQGEVWVVDNGSTDGTLDLLADIYTNTQVIINNHNVGFGAANNQGMQAAMSAAPRYFFLLNPDTVVRPGAMRKLVECLETQPEAGVAGARLVYPDGRFQHSAFSFPGLVQMAFDLWPLPSRLYESRINGRYARHMYQPDQEPFPVDLILGAAMMVRRDVAEKTGGFDESFHIYCEEVDWCWRIRAAGWKILMVPQAEIVHYGGSSTGQVPAQSVINLWTSRSHLYERMHGRLRLAVARRLAMRGLRRKARRCENEHLRKAYLQAASHWAEAELNGQPPDPVLEQ